MSEKGYFVHESSYIDEGAQIGQGTSIWHFCHVLTGVKIGQRCKIGQNVVVGPAVTIGNNVKIQNNVSIYRGVTLEDDVFCGPSMVFTNIATPRSAYPRNRPQDDFPTLVKRGASIGANATIVCGCTIGEHALIGAGAVVTRDVPPYALVYGNPARHRGWACECGEVLKFAVSSVPGSGSSVPGSGSSVPGSAEAARCQECGKSYRQTSEVAIERVEAAPAQQAA